MLVYMRYAAGMMSMRIADAGVEVTGACGGSTLVVIVISLNCYLAVARRTP